MLKSEQGFRQKRFDSRKVRNGTLAKQPTTIVIYKCQFCDELFYHRCKRYQHLQRVHLKEKGSQRLFSKTFCRRYRIYGPTSHDYGDNWTLNIICVTNQSTLPGNCSSESWLINCGIIKESKAKALVKKERASK